MSTLQVVQFLTRCRRSAPALLLALLSGLLSPAAWAQASAAGCGSLSNSYGPFDYRPDKYKVTAENNEPYERRLFLVHSAHFRPEMEALVRGGQGEKSEVGPELDYTLRAFPNHHRALVAMVRLGEKQKSEQARGARYTVECWLERALRFAPDDTVARLIFVSFLSKRNRVAEAEQQLATAEKAAGDNPFTHYNIGLLYFEIKNYDKALSQAHMAYGMGIALPDLRTRLEGVGKWREAPAVPSAVQGAVPAAGPSADPLAPTPKAP